MKRAALVALSLIAGFSPGSARAQAGALDSIFSACVAGDTATAWQKVMQPWALDTGGWTNDSLRRRLIALGRADQAVRDAPDIGDSVRDPAFVRRMNQADSINAHALLDIVARYGWPTRRLVGVAGGQAAFLIAQHNPSIQHQMLRLMEAAPPGQVQPTDVAMLEDRVRVAEGKPQRYGTQISMAGTGPAHFDSIEDLPHLGLRRAQAGLPPIGVYMCMMRGYSGREILDPYGRAP